MPTEYFVNIFLSETATHPALILKSIKDGVAEFSVNGVPNVTILDSRPAVISHLQDSKVFCHTPALVTIENLEDRTVYHLSPVPTGVKKSNIAYKMWIGSQFEGNIGTHKFISFNGSSNDYSNISFVTIFRYR